MSSCVYGVILLKEMAAVTLLCFCWVLINYCNAFTRMGGSKEIGTHLFGIVADAKTKITKWSLYLGPIEDALFNRILSKPYLIPFYPSHSFVLFNFLLPTSGAFSWPFVLLSLRSASPSFANHNQSSLIFIPPNYPVHFAVESWVWWLVPRLEYINMTLFQVASSVPVLASFKKLFIFTKVYNSIFIVCACDLGAFFPPCLLLIIIQHRLHP